MFTQGREGKQTDSHWAPSAISADTYHASPRPADVIAEHRKSDGVHVKVIFSVTLIISTLKVGLSGSHPSVAAVSVFECPWF